MLLQVWSLEAQGRPLNTIKRQFNTSVRCAMHSRSENLAVSTSSFAVSSVYEVFPFHILWISLTQYGHNICARFTLPQAEHLLKFVTSFNAFPAMNLCRFFLCEVFFFGTALSIDSHKPDKIDGIPRVKCVGIVIGKLKKDAEMSCWDVFQTVLDRTVGW